MTSSTPEPTVSIALAASAFPSTHVLTFGRVDVNKKQARLRNRYALVPEIDLGAYTCRAVIDWLDLRIRTSAVTQWKWVKKEIEDTIGGNPWVVDEPDEDQARGQSFRIRFQEPELGLVMKAMAAVHARWTLPSEPEVVGLEISIDMKPRVYSEESLARIFGVIARTHLSSRDVISEPTDRPRFVANDVDGTGVTTHVLAMTRGNRDIDDQLLIQTGKDIVATTDSTYYAGARDPVTTRPWRPPSVYPSGVQVLPASGVAEQSRSRSMMPPGGDDENGNVVCLGAPWTRSAASSRTPPLTSLGLSIDRRIM